MKNVLVNVENNVGHITLNNPEVHNALRINDIEIIKLTLSKWNDYDLKAILITGNGKSFSSGLFLDEFDQRAWNKNPITQICEAIENSRCPVICAINGGAFGGAVEIALSCDFRVANKSLSLMVPASSLGIHYEPSGLRRAINILGPSMTRRLFLLGEVISFEEVLKTYFVDFLVKDNETVLERSKKVVSTLDSKAPLAVIRMKRTITEILNNTVDLDRVEKRIKHCFNSADHKEALLARKEKRLPKFKGS